MGATATTRIGELETENGKLQDKKAKADKAKANSTGLWGFITRPYTLWCNARNPDIQVKGQTSPGAMGVWGSLKHALWPSSTGGYATAATVVVGLAVTADRMRNKHAKEERDSAFKTKCAVGAGLVAAAAVAAVGTKYAYDKYQDKQQPSESDFEEEEDFSTSQKDGSKASVVSNPSKGGTSKTKSTKAKGSNWMIWAVVIVLGLAAIGGAVYYFLFMNEEGSEEDAVPEGMDQV